jgi:hypothetical protein
MIERFDIDVNPEKDREVFDGLRQIQTQARQSESGISTIDKWRIIMRSKSAKLAAAAVITIALYVLLQIPGGLSSTAYGLQDTIEAYNSIRWLHIHESRATPRERRTELWLGCDEQGNVTKMRYQSDNAGDSVGPLILAGGSDSSEAWLAKHNVHLVGYGDVSIMLGFDVSELDPKLLIEKLMEEQDRDEALVHIDEPVEETEPITITVTYPQGSRSEDWKKVFRIDQATKLVVRIDKYELRNQEFQHIKTLEFFDYNQPIDQAMFALAGDVSDDAQVVDVSEVEAGLLQNDMTKEEIAVEITRQFFEAVIARDFSRAGQLYLAAPDFLVEQAFMGANLVQIVSLGPGHPDPDPDSDSMICSCKALAEFGGQYYEVDAWKVQVKRIDEDANRWLISGTSIKTSPASDPVTLSMDSADQSSAIYDGLEPGEFMHKWLVLGPLPYPVRDGIHFGSEEGQRVAFDTDLLDFTNFTPEVRIDNTDYQWVALESKYGIVDLNQLSGEKNDFNVAYVRARIEMPEGRAGTLGIGSDDGVRVWLNGELVHDNWLYRAVVPDDDRVPITFKKGTNQIVLKVQNALGPWGFCCRLLDE